MFKFDDDHHANIVHHTLTQYLLKAGLKKFGKVREKAVFKELLQIYLKDTPNPQEASNLTDEQCKDAL